MSNLATNIPYNILPPRWATFPTSFSAKILNDSADEMYEKNGVRKPIAFMTLLGAATAVTLGLVDVEMPGGSTMPTGKFIMIIAPPGSGKTRAGDEAYKTIRAFQELQKALYNEQVSEYKVKLAIWRKQRQAILELYPSQLDSYLDCDESSSELMSQLTKDLEEKLIQHERNRPKPPSALQLIGEEATIEAIHAILAKYPVLAMVSTEGGIISKSRAFQNLEQFNSFWSGSPVMISRKTGESFNLTDIRFSLLLSIQPDKTKPLVEGKDALSSGFTSRCMFFTTDRLGPDPLPISTLFKEGVCTPLERLHQRMDHLLLMNKARFDDPTLPRKCMKFSDEAVKVFEQVKYEIAQETVQGGHFVNVKEHASRLPEQIARVAATLQYFEDPDSDITTAILMDAVNICMYCSDCYLKLFDRPPREVSDAIMLNEWLNLNLRSNSSLRLINKNHIRQFGPNPLREKNRLNHALMVLQQQRIIGMFLWGRHHIIDLYPTVPIDSAQIAFLLGNPKKVG